MIKNSKGIVLLIVLVTVVIVVLLAGALMSLFTSQSRITHHQASRIQAHYASIGLINYTFEMIRAGTWAVPAAGTSYNRRWCRTGAVVPGTCDFVDASFPAPIQSMTIYVSSPNTPTVPGGPNCTIPPGAPGGNIGACVNVVTDYTYTP